MENYEQKYKEALEKAKRLYGEGTITESLSYVFPELKESEDERIRKELIDLIYKVYANTSYITCVEHEDMLAWLEKQGEQKSTIPKWKYKNDNTPLLRDSIILNKYGCVAKSPAGALVDDVWVLDYDELKKLPKEEFEEQCKKKLVEKYNITGIGSKNAQGKLGEMIKSLKSADKVEPKFHEGDWIVTNKKHIWYIDETPETTSYLYRLTNQYGEVEVAEFEVVDNVARLWTIKDAKDGDVLASNKSIFIFQEEYIVEKPTAYCGLMNGLFIEGNGACWTNEKCYPATKEQSDLLFSKMKEAGYEWDAENKVLKKISQEYPLTPDECIKFAWSEDDESHVRGILSVLQTARSKALVEQYKDSINSDIDWLVSLKQRIIC